MNAPLLAEAGLRLTYSIGLVGSLGFLGFSADPGAANWGQMIQENRLGLSTQPWGVIAPVIVIADLLHRHEPDGRRHRPSSPAGRQLMTVTENAVPRGGLVVQDLGVDLTGKDVDVVDDIDLVLKPGEVVGLVGESGSGKTTVGTSLLNYSRAGALHLLRQGAPRGSRRARHDVAGGPEDPRRGDRLRAAGPRVGAQPGHPDRQADRRADAAAQHRHRPVPHAGCARRSGGGGPAQRRRVPQPLRPPAVGRPGAARRVGHGVPAQAQGAGARRADDRSRRDHPGHGPRDDGRALPHPRGQRPVRHPRPRRRRQHRRPGGGDVRRSDRRAGPQGRDVQEPLAPLHPGAARLDPAPEPGAGAHRHPWSHPGAGRPSGRLPLPRPLRVRHRRLQGVGARAPARRARARRALHPRERDRHVGHLPRHGARTRTPTSRAR